MVDFQLPLPGLARDFNKLTKQEKDFIAYFSAIDMDGFRTLKEGAHVSYEVSEGPKGLLASKIKTLAVEAAAPAEPAPANMQQPAH